jgi:uncharacterized membrane protein
MLFGLGLMLPNGTVIIGAMPLIIGIWVLAKGLGWEQQLDRLLNDMRESATGGIWSSLLWGLAIVSVLLSVLTVWQVLTGSTSELNEYVTESYASIDVFDLDAVNRDVAVWVIALDQALTWIVVSTFSFALSLGVLRWKEGTFTGRSLLLFGLGGVIYTISRAIIEVLLTELSGDDYSLAFGEISDTWFLPIVATVLYYLLRTVVQSFEENDESLSTNRFWGV